MNGNRENESNGMNFVILWISVNIEGMSGEKGIKSGERFLTGNRVIYLFYIVYVIKNDRSLSHPIDVANKFLKKLSNGQYLFYHIN